ncbi:MAG: DHH family phosphoesterase [Nitrospinae bacterium]|nr:DHH family phosphoesterase [Nitrospinota bacterium]
MRYFLIVDSIGLGKALLPEVGARDEVFLLPVGRASKRSGSTAVNWPELRLSSSDRIIVCVADSDIREKKLAEIRDAAPKTPVLLVDYGGKYKKLRDEDETFATIEAGALFGAKAAEKWKEIELRKKTAAMRGAIDRGKPLWILVQNDPDPDALASAMALRKLLGLKASAAPIVTLKQVARSENVSMARLLKVKVREVLADDISGAPQVALVDVQPGYFSREFGNVKIVIDHHPRTVKCPGAFVDVRPSCGATSIILMEYLEANGTAIDPSLATALYYGIKTDTLALGREASGGGWRAFSELGPLADHGMVSQMERPRLESAEVAVFVRALRRFYIRRDCLFADLGRVYKEDLVPRIADFVMQIGEHKFSVVWGAVGREVTFAARSLNRAVDSGAVLRDVFGGLGSAGGHRVMARATIPAGVFKKAFGSGAAGKNAVTKKILNAVENLIERG